jgi:enoyl-CoA hydratase
VTEGTAPVLAEKRGRLGHLVLNRPEAINALNHEMVRLIQDTLDAWLTDDEVQTVLLTGSGERGLCAGGDIVSIYQDARDGGTASVDFWRDEYVLDAAIARYPKPFVAIMDGIVLGGGIGLSAHARHRIVTEKSSVGLPETTIGFVPDVGGTYLLSRAPGELGTHLALTAGSITGADAIAIGFADSFVPRERLPELIESLETTAAVAAIAAVQQPAPLSPLLEKRAWIDPAYASDDLATILDSLSSSGVEDAAAAAATIAKKSPTALHVTLAALRKARTLPSLEAALDQEFRVSIHSLGWPDLAEGIRAQVIDKDRNPQWNPATIDGVDPAATEAAFAPLPGGDLGLAHQTTS